MSINCFNYPFNFHLNYHNCFIFQNNFLPVFSLIKIFWELYLPRAFLQISGFISRIIKHMHLHVTD